jgi:plastocyanin
MKRLPWVLAVVALIIVGLMVVGSWWLLSQKNSNTPDQRNTAEALLDESTDRACGLPSAKTIAAQEQVMVRSTGFAPQEVVVRVGETVRWHNADGAKHQIMTDNHPTHETCFGLMSPVLEEGDSFGYTFTKPGTWRFHDEFNLQSAGQVTVTE